MGNNGHKMKFQFLILFLFSSCCFAYIEIPSVTLQTSDQKTKSIESNLPKQTVTEKQIKNLRPGSVSELLRQTTDIIVHDLNGDNTNSSISMRGFGDNGAQNALILINGQPLINPDLQSPDLNFLPISNVIRIETMQNSQSVLYGDQAVGGVVNIITASPSKPVKKINLGYGSFSAKNLQGEIANSFKNGIGYDLNLGHFDSNHYRNHNDEQKDHAALNLNYNTASSSSYLMLENINQDLQTPGGLMREQVIQNREQSQNNTDKEDTNNSIAMFGANNQISENWQTKVDGSAVYGTADGVNTFSNTHYDFDKTRKDFFLRPEISGDMKVSHLTLKPIFGADYRYSYYQYQSIIYQSKNTQNQMSAFTLFNIPFDRKFEFIAGARAAKSIEESNASMIDKTYQNSAFITTVEFLYHITPTLQAYIRRAGNYRFPKADEDTLTQNNQPLKTQIGASYELGTSWQIKKLTLLGEIYQLDLKNEIEYVPLINSASGFGYNQNLDRTRRRGFNLNADYQILKFWSANATYQYVRPKFIDGPYEGNYIPAVPEQTLTLGTIIHLCDHFYIFLNGDYIGSEYASADVQNKQILGGYTVINTGAGYQIKNVKIILKINNITDREYNAYMVMDNPTSQSPQLYYYPAAGINGSLDFTVDF